MTAYTPMATRFSVSDRAAAKVAKPAKAGFVPSGAARADPGEAAKVGPQPPDGPAQLSQAHAAAHPAETQDFPALSQVSQVSQPQDLKPEKGTTTAARPDEWLADIGRAIGTALAAGAERETDPDGWLLLIRPDGGRMVVAPHIVSELDRTWLLPALPDAVEHSTFAARARPPEWWDGTDRPQAGDRCRCGGSRFWTEPAQRGGWRCSTCNPPRHLGADGVLGVSTA